MSATNSEDDLISKILNETLNLNSTTGESSTVAIPKYHEIEFVILKNNLELIKLDYLAIYKLFRVNIKNQIIDFPENWTWFKKLKECYLKRELNFSYLVIDEKEDSDYLLKVLRPLLNFKGPNMLVLYNSENIWLCYGEQDCSTIIKEISKILPVMAA